MPEVLLADHTATGMPNVGREEHQRTFPGVPGTVTSAGGTEDKDTHTHLSFGKPGHWKLRAGHWGQIGVREGPDSTCGIPCHKVRAFTSALIPPEGPCDHPDKTELHYWCTGLDEDALGVLLMSGESELDF